MTDLWINPLLPIKVFNAAILIAAMIELVIMNRAHNEYASRPVPFFEDKEAEA